MTRGLEPRISERMRRAALLTVGLLLACSVVAGLPDSVDLAGGGWDVIVYGADRGDSLGIAQAATGDFNGDGVMDLLIGAHHADGPDESRPEAGEAYVAFGPEFPSAIDVRGVEGPRPDIVFFGKDGTRSGASSPQLQWGTADALGEVVTAGDLNNDGFDDLIVTAALADGPNNGRPDAGEVYVVFGRSAAAWEQLRPTGGGPIAVDVAGAVGMRPDVVIVGADEADLLLGSSSGDVNGDGIDDLLLAAGGGDGPGNSRLDSGEAYVVFGHSSASWPETLDLSRDRGDVTFYGAEAGDHLRWAVGAVSTATDGRPRGDMNGDGWTDLVLGASHADGAGNATPEAGELYVWHGRTEWLTSIDLATEQPDIWIGGGDTGGMLGFFSISLADVNGDGIDDLIAGASGAGGPPGATPSPARPEAGEAYVVFGRPQGIATMDRFIDLGSMAADVTIFGADAGDALGATVCGADVNGDGSDDILVGVPQAAGAGNLRPGSGEALVFYGRPSWPSRIDLATSRADSSLHGADPRDELASSLVSAGDVNGDGIDDILIGASGADGPRNSRADRSGETYVLFGAR